MMTMTPHPRRRQQQPHPSARIATRCRPPSTTYTNVDLVAEGTNSANAAIDDVQEDLTALQTSASAELQPEVQAVQEDIDALKTAAENLDSGGAADAAAAVSDFLNSAGTLLDSLDNGPCGSSTTT